MRISKETGLVQQDVFDVIQKPWIILPKHSPRDRMSSCAISAFSKSD